MAAVQTVSKRDAARAEIEGAIFVLALRRNFLAAELLGHAANDILMGVAQKHDLETLGRSFYEVYIKPEHVGDAKKLIRFTYNFLKHADRDAGTSIERYDPDTTIWSIFRGVLDYGICFHHRS